jgi:peptidoglycan hydrolase CwlO-like protein
MLMKNPHLVWAGAACVLVITLAAVILALNDKDPDVIRDVIVSAAVPLLGMFGFSLWKEVKEVKENTNGINSSFQQRLDEKDRKIESLQREMNDQSARVADSFQAKLDERDRKIEELQAEIKGMALLQSPPSEEK